LHHTESGATSLEYGAHAIAPNTDVPPDFWGNKPAISANTKLCIKARQTEITQINGEMAPTPAAIDPIENSTRAGTPLAIQKPCCQPIERCMP